MGDAKQSAESPAIIAVVGPTASGKTAWGMALAEALGGEIIGADSRQVYRGLDIGTAKPSRAERARVRHHCVDHVDPRERYHLARFLREARAALSDIQGRGRRAVLVGGSGQYVWALLEGWTVPEVAPDEAFRSAMEERAASEGAESLHAELAAVAPSTAERIPPGNVRRVIRALEVTRATGRPPPSRQVAADAPAAVIIGPRLESDALEARIEARVQGMFRAGIVEETREQLASGVPPDAPGLASIGYREVVRHLSGDLTLDAAQAEVERATRRLARRQRTWFRADDDRIQWCERLEEAHQAVAGV